MNTLTSPYVNIFTALPLPRFAGVTYALYFIVRLKRLLLVHPCTESGIHFLLSRLFPYKLEHKTVGFSVNSFVKYRQRVIVVVICEKAGFAL